MECLNGDPEIRLIELIRNVPSEGSKLPPLLNEGMEEAEAKEHLVPVLEIVLDTVVVVRVRDGVPHEGTEEIGSKTLRSLVRHLHAVLENRDREVG